MEFLNAGLLGLSALAAVPVLVHLLHRPKPKAQPFPSLMFLKRHARRSRALANLKNLLLMALRAAAVALLVLAVARPRIAGTAPDGGRDLSVALVLDDGFRMGYRSGGASHFDRAKQRALDVLASLPPGSKASLSLASGETIPMTPDLDAIRAELTSARVSEPAAPLLPAAVEGARSLEEADPERSEVHVFTDLARGAWSGSSEEALRSFRGITTYVHDVGEDKPVNAAITKVELHPASPQAGRIAEAVVSVSSWGRGGEITVAFEPSGAEAALEEVVNVPKDGTATARFQWTPEEGPVLFGTAGLKGSDPLDADDRRHFAAPVGESVQVLVVEGKPDEDLGVAPFVRYALSPPSLTRSRPVTVHSADPDDLPDFEDFDAIVVCDPVRLGFEDLNRLAAWVEVGGGLAVFASPATRLGELDGAVRAGLYPEVTGISETPAQLDLSSAAHPVFRVFRAGRNGDLGAASFARRLGLRKGSRWRPAVLFNDGSPAVLGTERAQGRLLAMAFAPAASWTDLPRYSSFVPLAHEVVRSLVGTRGVERDYPAGSPVILPLPRPPRKLDYELVNLRTGEALKRRAEAAVAALHVAGSLAPGAYAARGEGATRPFSVNLDPAGSDPTRLAREDLGRLLPQANLSFSFERATVTELKEARTGRELTVLALLAVALLLLVELWMAAKS